jgi:hypothetical protein
MGCRIEKNGDVFLNDVKKKASTHSAGYKVVWLDGKLQYIHRLVAETYIPNPENKPQVNHINGIKSDNRVENLEWTTSKQNMNHARDTKLWGENILNKRKLTDKQVREIRDKYVPYKYTFSKLADEYSVDYKTIWEVINNKSYKEI